nr:pol protein [Hymenolepis microstoma]CUU98439.1 pol protein [Hymenolepis microstoma]
MKQLKYKQSPGEESIRPEFLIRMGPKAKEILLTLFNKIWETSLEPTQWKVDIIIPILKKGKDSNNFDNYRPISLTSMLAKLMEGMVDTRLAWFLETNNSLGNDQSNFRPQKSTNQQMATLSQHTKDALDARNTLTAVSIDFKSAYDLDTPLEQTNESTYLGVTFDTKLTWKNLIAKIAERVSNRLNVLKRLAGSIWGCAHSTLNTTNKMFVQLTMLYCCETLVAASVAILKPLEKSYN